MMRVIAGTLLCIAALMLAGCAGSASRSVRADGETIDLMGLDKQRAQVVMAALSQVGTPYVYGGTEPGRALDCSGLTQYAHSVAGVSIPRISTAQQAAAVPVRRRPAPGDLVFFETAPSQYHVGLMVDSDRFVHASTSKQRVKLARLGGIYWQQRFLGAGTYLR